MSALNFNKVLLCGRLTADIELKMTQSERRVTTFSLAVNRPRTSGSTEQKADFVPCVAWDNIAEFLHKYFHKGDSVFIVGKLRIRSYKNREGQNVYVTEIVIDEANFVDSKSAKETPPDPSEYEIAGESDDLPF